jgi:signal peptidase II
MTGALLAAAAAAMLVDQVSKSIARRLLVESGSGSRFGGRSGLRWVLNPRGSLVRMPVSVALALWFVALGVAIAAVTQASAAIGIATAVGVGLVLGGAAGNLGDRVLRGAVADFIAVWRWPPFNLADASMVAGTILLAGALV